LKRMRFDKGAATVEYALVILVAATAAGVLLAITKGEAFMAALTGIVLKALG